VLFNFNKKTRGVSLVAVMLMAVIGLVAMLAMAQLLTTTMKSQQQSAQHADFDTIRSSLSILLAGEGACDGAFIARAGGEVKITDVTTLGTSVIGLKEVQMASDNIVTFEQSLAGGLRVNALDLIVTNVPYTQGTGTVGADSISRRVAGSNCAGNNDGCYMRYASLRLIAVPKSGSNKKALRFQPQPLFLIAVNDVGETGTGVFEIVSCFVPADEKVGNLGEDDSYSGSPGLEGRAVGNDLNR
jgi:hypothetical protein